MVHERVSSEDEVQSDSLFPVWRLHRLCINPINLTVFYIIEITLHVHSFNPIGKPYEPQPTRNLTF